MRKLIYLALSLFFVIGLDFGLSKTNLPVNEKSYLMGFKNFRVLAKETLGQKRIILVGDSSIGWGVSAKELTSRLGMLTLNSGIHAKVGFRGFMRNIYDVIDKDNDLLVFSPEYSIVSEDSSFSRTEVFCEITNFVVRTYAFECVGYSLAKMLRVIPILDRGQGDYKSDGFNEFGDFVFRSIGRNMVGKSSEVDTCSGWEISDLEDKYIPYMKELDSIGYSIVYIPNVLSEISCKDPEKVRQFHKVLFTEFGIKGFEDAQLLFEERNFYDTPYHLTTEGVKMKTNFFMEQLNSFLGGQ